MLHLRRVSAMGSSPTGWGVHVRQFLDATFPSLWIGRDYPTPWPPRSLDFLWEYVKDKLCSTPVPGTDILKSRIRDVGGSMARNQV
jgi:hypothetical protein